MAPLAMKLLSALTPTGAMMIIEPALRETSRALHELRDTLLTSRAAHVFAPCTRTAAPCPALADPRDWCHEDRPFTPPPRLAQLVRATGLRREGLKFAYLTLRREPAPLVPTVADSRALRVVSDALDQKGTTERILCGDDGRAPRRILRRDRTDANRALGDSRRGDVLVDDGTSLTRITCRSEA
jgi:ribosomal protein RSM22 (predicted rRNA methylase)